MLGFNGVTLVLFCSIVAIGITQNPYGPPGMAPPGSSGAPGAQSGAPSSMGAGYSDIVQDTKGTPHTQNMYGGHLHTSQYRPSLPTSQPAAAKNTYLQNQASPNNFLTQFTSSGGFAGNSQQAAAAAQSQALIPQTRNPGFPRPNMGAYNQFSGSGQNAPPNMNPQLQMPIGVPNAPQPTPVVVAPVTVGANSPGAYTSMMGELRAKMRLLGLKLKQKQLNSENKMGSNLITSGANTNIVGMQKAANSVQNNMYSAQKPTNQNATPNNNSPINTFPSQFPAQAWSQQYKNSQSTSNMFNQQKPQQQSWPQQQQQQQQFKPPQQQQQQYQQQQPQNQFKPTQQTFQQQQQQRNQQPQQQQYNQMQPSSYQPQPQQQPAMRQPAQNYNQPPPTMMPTQSSPPKPRKIQDMLQMLLAFQQSMKAGSWGQPQSKPAAPQNNFFQKPASTPFTPTKSQNVFNQNAQQQQQYQPAKHQNNMFQNTQQQQQPQQNNLFQKPPQQPFGQPQPQQQNNNMFFQKPPPQQPFGQPTSQNNLYNQPPPQFPSTAPSLAPTPWNTPNQPQPSPGGPQNQPQQNALASNPWNQPPPPQNSLAPAWGAPNPPQQNAAPAPWGAPNQPQQNSLAPAPWRTQNQPPQQNSFAPPPWQNQPPQNQPQRIYFGNNKPWMQPPPQQPQPPQNSLVPTSWNTQPQGFSGNGQKTLGMPPPPVPMAGPWGQAAPPMGNPFGNNMGQGPPQGPRMGNPFGTPPAPAGQPPMNGPMNPPMNGGPMTPPVAGPTVDPLIAAANATLPAALPASVTSTAGPMTTAVLATTMAPIGPRIPTTGVMTPMGWLPPPFNDGKPSECPTVVTPGRLCCDGHWSMVPKDGGHWMCCDKGIYNLKMQICVDKMVMRRPPGTGFKIACGKMGILYNPLTALCCDKMITPNINNTMKCCGKHHFDPATHECCGKGIRPRNLDPESIHLKCCGAADYDPATHICCNENPFPLSMGAGMPPGKAMSCCGKGVIVPGQTKCCWGDPIPQMAMCF